MQKNFASLLCTNQQKNSINDDSMSIYATVDETSRRLTKLNTFIRHFHTFYRRVSNRFRRKNRPAVPTSITRLSSIHLENHENIYETISWDYHTEEIIETVIVHPLQLIKRTPPQLTWKHSWTTDETTDALLISPFSLISNEIYLEIFQYFSIRDLANVSLVCRQFKMIADDDMLWKIKCNTSNKILSKSFKEIYMNWMFEKYLRNLELEEIKNSYFNGYLPIHGFVDDIFDESINNYIPSINGFKQHPNSRQEMTIQLSVDLDKIISELISLLEKASAFQINWYKKPIIIKQMILRYYRFMKLKSFYPSNILLIPTLDIEIIWQTHLLRSEIYRKDCIRLFGRIIDHSLIMDDIQQFLKEQAFIETCQLYEEHFGEKYCSLPIDIENRKRIPKYKKIFYMEEEYQCIIPIYSYWDETDFKFSEEILNNFENPFSFTDFDIITDGHWLDLYKKFMYETRPNTMNSYTILLFEEYEKLNSSKIHLLKKSYERFLYIISKYSSKDRHDFDLKITYAIDLVWRSHLQEPLKYSSDCRKFVGYVMDYIPEQVTKTNEMNKLWKSEFNCDMITDHLHKIRPKNDEQMYFEFF